jgi:hypothetical protein
LQSKDPMFANPGYGPHLGVFAARLADFAGK